MSAPHTASKAMLLRHPAGCIALGFGAGLSPIAPGTVGSAVALIPWFALRELPWPFYAIAIAAMFGLGVWACGWFAAALRVEDPGAAVFDEFVGLWIAFAPLVGGDRGIVWIGAGFILFRIFDIWKPWPVSWADRRGGGLGIMLDDALAGVYAALILFALRAALS
ncbi:MAG TPA: phosphatidylglycerophosphatase A [Rudaea sp.]